ncbi:cyclic pyranopterin monophosphate synthase MoaC [Methylophilaceae bacterium]|jgi:cyclic pyranopterin phosphate synthase|nr:cyclic pyranopterin monophosphate synthase MoaC [Methylophilaceae bacterium]|tara:strand:+ start:2836 stop:3309 length:474 start_codon:yes stop_codon:yes gene_type:complete
MLTHIDKNGNAKMVGISDKDNTNRIAIASGFIKLNKETINLVEIGSLKKGDVLTVAKIAAIQAAKKTSDLIPLCHNINLNKIDIEFNIDTLEKKIDCKSSVECFSKTGAEMEALTAVSVALLTIYDMCKASDKNMVISEIKLLEKRGGKSGTWLTKK